jgi:RNA recognition motif-containing protein
MLMGTEISIQKYIKKSERPLKETEFNNIYVKEIPKEKYSDEDLKELFSKYGEILSCKVMSDENLNSKGFGFVCFKEPVSAEAAVKDHIELFGEKVFVSKAMKKSLRAQQIKKRTELYKNSLKKFNLYIKNFGPDTTEEELVKFFSHFGQLRNVKIPKEEIRDAEGNVKFQNRGYAFVCFIKQEDAAKAKKEAEKMLFQGTHLYVSFFENKETRLAKLEEQRDKREFQRLSFAGGAAGPFPSNPSMEMFTRLVYDLFANFNKGGAGGAPGQMGGLQGMQGFMNRGGMDAGRMHPKMQFNRGGRPPMGGGGMPPRMGQYPPNMMQQPMGGPPQNMPG